MKLSYSQISKYSQCPRSFRYYYLDRLREKTATSYLTFGSAMDSALNSILIDYKHNKSVSISYKGIFDKHWETTEINKRKYKAIDCVLLGYAKNDFQFELLTKDDINFINAKIDELAPDLDKKDLTELKEKLEDKKSKRNIIPFLENEHKILNIMNWFSLKHKAHLMLDAYVRDIIPQIEEVVHIQKQIQLGSNTDNTLVGYIDAVVRFKGHDGLVVLDNKTSSSMYELSRVASSQQLGLYCYTLNITKAAYAVMIKNIKLNKTKICSKCKYDGSGSRHKTCSNEIDNKRCNGEWIETPNPEAITQLFIDEVPQRNQEVIVDNLADINDAIEAKVFPQNLNTCNNIYGNPCSYKRLCWKGSDNNLEKLD